MIRAALLLVATASVTAAGLTSDVKEQPFEPPALADVAVPCLDENDERRYVVRWEIRNTETGERRNVGSQEVRLRC